MKKERDVAEDCINCWGEDSQINVAIEECAELITELAKRFRVVNGTNEIMICGEIADVEIMMYQLRLIYNSDLVDKIKVRKLKALSERVDKELKLKAREKSFKQHIEG